MGEIFGVHLWFWERIGGPYLRQLIQEMKKLRQSNIAMENPITSNRNLIFPNGR